MHRIFIYSSTFLGGYIFYAVIILLSYFKLISYEFSIVFNMLALFDIFLVLGIVLAMLAIGAEINE